MNIKKYLFLLFCTVFLFASINATAKEFSPYVDEDGNISLPTDFRNQMTHLGSWFVPEGDASGFHDVYTEQESLEAFRKTGSFPDGATIVKELRAHHSGDFTTGTNINYPGEIKLWFVMIKDSQGRFPNNKVWAEGWGWALIKTDDPNKNTATNFQKDCMACHTPARETDWVFIDGYPTLKAQ